MHSSMGIIENLQALILLTAALGFPIWAPTFIVTSTATILYGYLAYRKTEVSKRKFIIVMGAIFIFIQITSCIAYYYFIKGSADDYFWGTFICGVPFWGPILIIGSISTFIYSFHLSDFKEPFKNKIVLILIAIFIVLQMSFCLIYYYGLANLNILW